jgi:hypothetical protein
MGYRLVHHRATEPEGELTEDSRIDYPLDTEKEPVI